MPIPDIPKPPISIEPPSASVDVPVPSSSHVNREEIGKFINEQENQNTTKKRTLSDIKKLEKYMIDHGETRKVHEIPMEELDEKIAGFLMTIKKPDGEDNEPSSIRNMISSFDRKVRRHGYKYSTIRSETNAFSLTRETLKVNNPFCPVNLDILFSKSIRKLKYKKENYYKTLKSFAKLSENKKSLVIYSCFPMMYSKTFLFFSTVLRYPDPEDLFFNSVI